ncbi:hypothetical protein [Rufibacter hautae]|uniref:Uncharacterized protein n=1 Tax=Rufibacter hautae TaxID=2595005 RepID=A0A5B6TKW9_9BACT|nr:hypothetical protein [Rufibacter hautae]KAA3440037.1 hypothetical protein FOA19_05040 [Rufibacter hautae]
MKSILFSTVLLFVVTTSYSQGVVEKTYSQEYYLQKSKSQKKLGWILTGGGLGLATGGFITLTAHNPLWNPKEPQTTIGATMTLIGLASMAVGVFPFISAGSYKRKARSVAIGPTHISLPQPGTAVTKAAPAVGVQISF